VSRSTHERPLAGKVALVTGGSRGIGAAIAKRLAADGASVAVTYSKGADAASSVVKEIERGGGKAIAIQADAADAEAVRNAVERTVRCASSTVSMPIAMSSSRCRSTVSRPPRRRRRTNAGSRTSRETAAAATRSSPTGKRSAFSPSLRYSPDPPVPVATTRHPVAIASSGASPKGSGQTVGNRRTSLSRYMSGMSSCIIASHQTMSSSTDSFSARALRYDAYTSSRQPTICRRARRPARSSVDRTATAVWVPLRFSTLPA